MNKKQVIKINENQLKQIVTESVKKMLKEESIFDKAADGFENIKEYFDSDKDALIGYLWFYIDNKPGFIEYMKTSLNYCPPDEEDY